MSAYIDLIRPRRKQATLAFDLLCVLGGSLFLALMAQVAIPLWFTPVPLTLHTFAILLMGALLGSKRGTLAVILYLAEGALGLPVFAGGAFGWARLLGPTGGYLLSFILATYLIGYLLERGWRTSYLRTLFALMIGEAIILLLGTLWLSMSVGMDKAFMLGFVPFIPGEMVKILATALLIPTGWKFIHCKALTQSE